MPTIKASDYKYNISTLDTLDIGIYDTALDVKEKIDTESQNLKKYVRKQIAISRWKNGHK